jgi:hypothetical protein
VKKLDNETTALNPDHREQLDLSTPHPIPGPDAPLYHNLLAPNQWPSPEYLPEFRPVFEEYIRRMSQISNLFTSLIAEAIGLPPDAFDKFFDKDQQHKLKIVQYPEVDVPDLPADATPMERKKWEIKRQGVGPQYVEYTQSSEDSSTDFWTARTRCSLHIFCKPAINLASKRRMQEANGLIASLSTARSL